MVGNDPHLFVRAVVTANADTRRRVWYYRSRACLIFMATVGMPLALAAYPLWVGKPGMFGSVLAATYASIAMGSSLLFPLCDTVFQPFQFYKEPKAWKCCGMGQFFRSMALSREQWDQIVSPELRYNEGYTHPAYITEDTLSKSRLTVDLE